MLWRKHSAKILPPIWGLLSSALAWSLAGGSLAADNFGTPKAEPLATSTNVHINQSISLGLQLTHDACVAAKRGRESFGLRFSGIEANARAEGAYRVTLARSGKAIGDFSLYSLVPGGSRNLSFLLPPGWAKDLRHLGTECRLHVQIEHLGSPNSGGGIVVDRIEVIQY